MGESLKRLLALPALLFLLFALATKACATDVEQAWSKFLTESNNLNVAPSLLKVDRAGNSYLLMGQFGSAFVSPAHGSTIRKVDPFGNVLWEHNEFSWQAFDLCFDLSGNVFVTGRIPATAVGTVDTLFVEKIAPDRSGNWFETYEGQSNPGDYGFAVTADGSGGCYLGAIENGDLLLLHYSATGQLQSTHRNQGLGFNGGFFTSQGELVATGVSRTSAGVGYSVEDLNGNGVFGNAFTNDVTDSFSVSPTSDLAGNIYVAVIDLGSTGTSFQVQAFTAAGKSLWTSNSEPGRPGQIVAGDPNDCYLLGTANNSTVLWRYDQTGTRRVFLATSPGLIAPDGSTGVVLQSIFPNAANPSSVAVTEFSAQGSSLWTQFIGAPIPNSSVLLGVVGGMVYSVYQNLISNIPGIQVSKYVQGLALAGVSSTPTKVQGGTPVSLAVDLSEPAAASGFEVQLAGNPLLGVPSLVTIASGQTQKVIGVDTVPVDSPVPAAVIAKAGGVVRSTSILLTPAVLTEVKFPSSATVHGGTPMDGEVVLSGATGLIGRTVALSSNVSGATVPGTVNVRPGAAIAGFVVQTPKVSQNTTVTVTATLSGVSVKGSFVVTP